MYTTIQYPISQEQSTTLEFRVLALLDDIEMDRKTIEPLLVKEETVRDGEALAQQAGDEIFGITLFLIALISISFGLWMLVITRRMNRQDDDSNDGLDQTDQVIEEQNQYKQVPDIIEPIPAIPQVEQTMPLSMPLPMPLPMPNQQVLPQPAGNQLTNNPGIAPLPPTGLPDGWTMDQWEHYGWKYMESFKK